MPPSAICETAEKLHIYDNHGILQEVHDIMPNQQEEDGGFESDDSDFNVNIPANIIEETREMQGDIAIIQNMSAWRQIQKFWQKAAITSHKKLSVLENYGFKGFVQRMSIRLIAVSISTKSLIPRLIPYRNTPI